MRAFVAIAIVSALGPFADAAPRSSCAPIGTWKLAVTKLSPTNGVKNCKLPALTGGTLVVTKVANQAPYAGTGTWNGKPLDKLATIDDAGIWDLSAFVPGDDNLLVIVRVKTSAVVEGEIIRQPKHDGKLGDCIDHFLLKGSCS